MVCFGNDWDKILGEEFTKDYYIALRKFLVEEYNNYRVFPEMNNIYNALKSTACKDVRAVIIGQDPYHSAGQAHGLCFSVQRGVTPPPSLVNIFKELRDDLGIALPSSGELTPWTRQGVLLLNTVLTVREGCPGSHRNKGWEILTDKVIAELNMREKPMVFLLWGSYAKAKAPLITNPHHLILTAVHPSPLSAYQGWFGCKHFSKTNEFLRKNGIEEIDWSLA